MTGPAASPPPPAFTVARVDFTTSLDALRAVRDAVFIHEQGVPLELEHDARDPHCLHVLARDADGHPIGTGRLVPPSTEAGLPHIGRMAVLPAWRGQGVGSALLAALTDWASQQGWRTLALNAQASALPFYARQGYEAHGPRFMEAGIEHQAMRRTLT